MSNYQTYVGIDVSKEHLDITLMQSLKVCEHTRIENNVNAIKAYINKHAKGYDFSQALFCLEATGLYMNPLLSVLSLNSWATWVENPVEIKRSLGLRRGKNDKVDAARIAEYATRFSDKARLYRPKDELMSQLQSLDNLREQLVESRKRLKTTYQENERFMFSSSFAVYKQHSEPILESLTKEIQLIEKQMQEFLAQDADLKAMYEITCSVVGVGKITAMAVLIVTEGFQRFKQGNKFACHCGVVPFENSSGKFKGRERVSRMANKRLKKLLHMCALSAISQQGELRDYYLRKLEENKPKMSILNAVRNKIIQRIFACIRKGEMYQKNFLKV